MDYVELNIFVLKNKFKFFIIMCVYRVIKVESIMFYLLSCFGYY